MKAITTIRAPQYGKPIQLWEKWGNKYAKNHGIQLPSFLQSTVLYKRHKIKPSLRTNARTIENNYAYDLYVYLKARKPRAFSRIN